MVWFCWSGYRNAKTTTQPGLRSTQMAQLADSVYFLGFIWTLYALIDAFVFKSLSGAEGIFSVFGYALVTTATGMFLRMFLLQFIYRTHDQASEAQLTVEEELQQFTSGMAAAMKALQEFNDASSTTSMVFQDLKPALEELKTSVTDVTHAVIAGALHLRNETTAAVQEVQEATRSGRRTMDEVLEVGVAEVRASLAVLSSKIEDGAGSIETGLMQLAARIDQIRIPADIEAKTEGLSATVQAVEAALAGLSSDIHAGGEGVQTELQDFADHIHQLRLPESLVVKVDEFNSAVADLQAALVLLGKALGSGSNEIGVGAKNVETTLSEFADDVKKIRLPEEIASRLQQLESALSEIVGIVRQQTRRLSYSAIQVLHSGDW